MLKLGVFGASGRVGRLLLESASKNDALVVSSVYARDGMEFLEYNKHNYFVATTIDSFLENCECVIDFSSTQGTLELLKVIKDFPRPMVIGTTGFSIQEFQILKDSSEVVPILYASNMSRGVAVLDKIAGIVSKVLSGSEIEITEIHHHHKKDAPSGTALRLAQTCARARNLDLSQVRVSGRDGNVGSRRKDEIGVFALRGGDVVGKHTIGFYLDGEYLELTHNATNRITFAKGALDAASWIVKQKAGLYGIEDILHITNCM